MSDNGPAAVVPGEHTSLVEMRGVGKHYGHIYALKGVSLSVSSSEVTCVLGDNGAGKSTLIKILAGVHGHDEGSFLMEGREVRFHSPRDAKSAGIATVYQNLAVVELMPVWRNFFLGSERIKSRWPIKALDVDFPAPLSPSTHVTSPSLTYVLTSRSARMLP